MKIWQKLTIALGGSSFLLATIGLLTIELDKQVQFETNETVHGMVSEAKAASEIFTSIQSIQELNQDFLINSQIEALKKEQRKQYQKKVELELNQLEQNIKRAQEATLTQKQIIHSSFIGHISSKEAKISEEKGEIENLNVLLKEVKLYKKEWQFFLANIKGQEEMSFDLAKNFTKRMNQIIFPLVKEYYENSLEEISRGELATQELTSQNIKIIKNYVWFSFALSLILFIYVYRSIYVPIKRLKVATGKLDQNFSEYQPILSKNSEDELGDLTKYFNETIARLKGKVTSKSYLDNIINSISQSLIVMDLENKITKINQNTSEILGYSETELVGQSIDYILARSNVLKIDEFRELDNISNQCFGLVFMTKDSKQISLAVYFSDLFDENKEKKGTICLATLLDNLSLKGMLTLQNSKEKAKSLKAF